MAASQPSYVLRGLFGAIPALRDEFGNRYDWVPCQAQPFAFDEDAPINVRRSAAQQCLACPALTPCGRMRDSLGNQARGVWAGQIMTKRGETDADRRLPVGPQRRRRAKVLSAVEMPLPDRVSIIRDEEPGGT